MHCQHVRMVLIFFFAMKLYFGENLCLLQSTSSCTALDGDNTGFFVTCEAKVRRLKPRCGVSWATMHLLIVSRAQFARNNPVRDLGQIVNSHVEDFIL